MFFNTNGRAIKRSVNKTELLTLLQRQFYALRDLKVKQEFDRLELHYLTNYGQVKPFVKVKIVFHKDRLVYSELNPYSNKKIIDFLIPWKCEVNISRKDILKLECEGDEYAFILNQLK